MNLDSIELVGILRNVPFASFTGAEDQNRLPSVGWEVSIHLPSAAYTWVRRAFRALAVFLAATAVASAQSSYTEKMYRRALIENSTAPLFVLVTLRSETGEQRLVCILANFLLGAIHMESRMKYDALGERKMLEIAVKQPGRVFYFSDPKARQNVEPSYSDAILSEVRSALASMSDGELLAQVKYRPEFNKAQVARMDKQAAFTFLKSLGSSLQRLYLSRMSTKDYEAYRDAVAQVLLEHGILVGIRDIGGGLYVPDTTSSPSPEPPPPAAR